MLGVTNPPALDVEDVTLSPLVAHLVRSGEVVVNLRDVVDPSGRRWGSLYGLAPVDGPVYPVEPRRRPEAFVLVWDGVARRPERFRTYGEAVSWLEAA